MDNNGEINGIPLNKTAKRKLKHTAGTVFGLSLLFVVLQYLLNIDLIVAFLHRYLHAERLCNVLASSKIFRVLFPLIGQTAVYVVTYQAALKNLKLSNKGLLLGKGRLPRKWYKLVIFSLGMSFTVNYICYLLFSRFMPPAPNDTPNEALSQTVYSVLAIIAAPIGEEALFRGVFLKSLAPFGQKTAIIISAFVFGMCHGSPTSIIHGFTMGIMLGIAYFKTSNIRLCVLIHFLNNAIAVWSDLLPKYIHIDIVVTARGLVIVVCSGFFIFYGLKYFANNRLKDINDYPVVKTELFVKSKKDIASALLTNFSFFIFVAMIIGEICLSYIS